MEQKELQIELDGETAAGKYANLAVISHSENEFIMDFILAFPPKGKVNARVITSPSHIKRFAQALEQNIAQYETKFGKIKEMGGPEQEFGIKLSPN